MICISCGKELKEGTLFCTRCGRVVNESDAVTYESENVQSVQSQTANHQTVNQQETNYQSMSNQIPNQQYNNQKIYGLNDINHQQGQSYGYPYSNHGYRQPVNGYGITPEKIYKRSVLPYKIVSAILNLLSVAAIFIIAVVAIAFEEDEFNDYFKLSWVEGFQTYGFIALLISVVLFVFVILGFALPAKAGVGTNLLTSIAGMVLAVWGTVLYSVLLSKVSDYIRDIGYVYNDGVKPGLCMMIAIGVMSIFLQMISFVFSCLGLARKKQF